MPRPDLEITLEILPTTRSEKWNRLWLWLLSDDAEVESDDAKVDVSSAKDGAPDA